MSYLSVLRVMLIKWGGVRGKWYDLLPLFWIFLLGLKPMYFLLLFVSANFFYRKDNSAMEGPPVHEEFPRLLVLARTVRTLKWSHFRVDIHVFLQVLLQRESFLTVLTSVGFDLKVGLHVSAQRVLGRVLLATLVHITLEVAT